MQKHGYDKCVARVKERSAEEEPLLDFTSGYVQRSIALLPKQGRKAPWKLYQNYFLDLMGLRYGGIEDGVIELSRAR
jgi:monooxygenase